MNAKTLFFLIASLFSQIALSQLPCSNEPVFEFIHANEIRTIIGNVGINFNDRNFDNFEVSYGQEGLFFRDLGFHQTLWLGGLDPGGNLKVAANTYGISSGQRDFWPGPLINGFTENFICANWNRQWTVRRHQIEAHVADFEEDGTISNLQPDIFGWPGTGNPYFLLVNGFALPDSPQGFAPFFDRDEDGIYDPIKGDYPLPDKVERIPEQILWCAFNDEGAGALHGETNGVPIRMETHQTVWAYSCEANPVLNRTLFFSYKFINRAFEDINDLYAGFFNDIDIRCHNNDGFGSNKELNTVFAYNLTNDDSTQGCPDLSTDEENPPVIASTILNKDLAYSVQVSVAGNLCSGAPQDALDYYQILTGNTGNGPLTFGENGCNPDNPPTNLIFPDDPNDPDGWSYLNVFPDTLLDSRFVYSIKLNDLGPGEFDVVEMAISHHSSPNLSNLENVTLMYEQVGEIIERYNNHFIDNCEQPFCFDDCVWPGDANRDNIANHCDLLDIGLAISESGPVRPNSFNWAPHDGTPWNGSSTNGVNLKHTDCDGSGTTDQKDFEITVANYNLKTPDFTFIDDVYNDGPELYIEETVTNTSFENVEPGETIVTGVFITNVPDLFGLAFQLEFDERYFEKITPGESESYFFTDDEMTFNSELNISGNDGIVDHAICMAQKDSTIKEGKLFNQFIKVTDDPNIFLPSNQTTIRFKNIKAIKSDGSIIDIGGTSQEITFSGLPINSVDEKIKNPLSVFPNPTKQLINLELKGGELDEAVIYDAFGKIIFSGKINHSSSTIDIAQFSNGIYWLKALSGDEIYFKKIIVSK